MSASESKIAIFCVGNKLMLDDGIGPAVYEELTQSYVFPDNVRLFDVGCMSMELISAVDEYDYIISVDAIDGTDKEPGTVFEYVPEDMARHSKAMASLHDLKLIDLFDAASLLGYEAKGKCFGIQVENSSPSIVTIGLTKAVNNALPLLIDAVLADLFYNGVIVISKETGKPIEEGWHHTPIE